MTSHDFTHAILRTPGRSVVSGLRMHDGPGPSYEGVLTEHTAYAQALREAGLTVDVLEPLEDYPDAIFVEDPALVFTEGAILMKPGAASRQGEVALIRPALARHFERVIAMGDGYADGGDIMVTPDKVLIGLSARTDATGAASLIEALAELGYTGEVVDPPREALHLKTIAAPIDDETILTTRVGETLFPGFRTIVVDPGEEAACNALRINDTLFLSARHPRIAERLDREGYKLHLLDTTHIARIDAGLSCMSLRWKAA